MKVCEVVKFANGEFAIRAKSSWNNSGYEYLDLNAFCYWWYEPYQIQKWCVGTECYVRRRYADYVREKGSPGYDVGTPIDLSEPETPLNHEIAYERIEQPTLLSKFLRIFGVGA